jgi:drug/metabolite transporter (DMT)-like permease
MNKRALRADFLLLLTAGIWGFGFVAQRSGMEHIGPFAFNGIRFILGSLSLLPLILIRRRHSAKQNTRQDARQNARHPAIENNTAPLSFPFIPSFVAGSCLFIAVMLQQFGIIFTTAGNAGFITGLYVVLTPIFGILLGRKTGLATWIGSFITFIGLYFISVAGRPSINPGDLLIFVSSFFWAAHVLLIDRLMQGKHDVLIDPVELSSGQFAVCGIFSLLGAFLFEPHVITVIEYIDPSLLNAGLFGWLPFPELVASVNMGIISFPVQALIPILYGGLCSVGIAYTLQVVAQRDAPPAHAVIILCFEGCFAVLGGILLLSEKAGAWTLLGCFFMLAGMLSTQWEVIKRDKNTA